MYVAEACNSFHSPWRIPALQVTFGRPGNIHCSVLMILEPWIKVILWHRKHIVMGLVVAIVECAHLFLMLAPIPFTLVTLPLDVIKITFNFNIIFYLMTVSRGEHIPRLYPFTLLSVFASALSFPLPFHLSPAKPTRDNRPAARLSIKSVTPFHSRRVICGIMHTNHFSTKLFLNSPFRGWQQLILGLLRVCHVHNERVRLKDKATHLPCICRAGAHVPLLVQLTEWHQCDLQLLQQLRDDL